MHNSKGQEYEIYTIVKGMETFYRQHTVPVTSCSEVKYVLICTITYSYKDYMRNESVACANVLGLTS